MAVAGTEYNVGPISISWTLGEEITETFLNPSCNLTQGYQQQLYNLKANAGPDQTINNGTTAQLHGSVGGGSGYYQYYWSPGHLLNDSLALNPVTDILSTSTVFTLHVLDQKNGCRHADPMSVFVAGGPLGVQASANFDTICAGKSIQLYALPTGGSGNYTYTWSSNPPGFSSTLQNPVDTPVVSRTYTVNVFDGFTNMTGQVSLVVNPSPAQFTVVGGGSFCEGSQGVEVGLAGSEQGITYELLLNGSSTGQAIQGTGGYLNFGMKNVEGLYVVTGTNGTCSRNMTGSAFLTLIKMPTAMAGPNDTICVNDIYPVKNAFAESFSSLFWSSTGSGFFVNNGTLTPVYHPSSGDYNAGSVVLALEANSITPCPGSVSSSFTLHFRGLPLSEAGSDQAICSNELYKVDGSSASNYSSLHWSTTGNGHFDYPASLHPTYTPGSDDIIKGSVNLTLTSKGYGGCGESSDQMSLSFKPSPIAGFTAGSVCDGTPVDFINSSSGQGNLSFEWSFGDGESSTEQHPSHVYSTFGHYTPTLTTTGENDCCDSISMQLAIKQQSKAVFSVSSTNLYIGDSTFFTNLSENFTWFRWYFGDGDSTAIHDPAHYYTHTGDYQAVLLTNNDDGCSDSSSVTIKIGMHSESDFDIILYPNPVVDLCFLKFYLSAFADVSVELYDPSSRLVRQFAFPGLPEGVQLLSINTQDLANGSYVLAVYVNHILSNNGSFNNGTLKDKPLRYESYGKMVKITAKN